MIIQLKSLNTSLSCSFMLCVTSRWMPIPWTCMVSLSLYPPHLNSKLPLNWSLPMLSVTTYMFFGNLFNMWLWTKSLNWNSAPCFLNQLLSMWLRYQKPLYITWLYIHPFTKRIIRTNAYWKAFTFFFLTPVIHKYFHKHYILLDPGCGRREYYSADVQSTVWVCVYDANELKNYQKQW